MTRYQHAGFEPRPLLFNDRKVAIAWSPKSACTHVVTWFFLKQGLLPAADHLSAWPHKFRHEVYYRGDTYEHRLALLTQDQGEGWTLIKFTRNPTRRLISQFRHVIQYPLIDQLMMDRTGLDVATHGMSLDDYHAALSGVNLRQNEKVNIHIWQQKTALWNWGWDRIITINMDETNLLEGTQEIERKLGLGVVDTTKHPKFAQIRERHSATDQAWEGGDLVTHRFHRKHTKDFPKKALEGLPAAERIAWKLYAEDWHECSTSDIIAQSHRVAAK